VEDDALIQAAHEVCSHPNQLSYSTYSRFCRIALIVEH
jgi:hypothetical protein